MKKLVSILMILAMIIPLAGAQSTDIFKKKKKKKSKTEAVDKAKADSIAKSKKDALQPYAKVITGKAKTMDGFFKVHYVDGKYFFEIADSLFGRDILIVNRVVKAPVDAQKRKVGYPGDYISDEVIRFEKGRGDKLFVREISYLEHSADTLGMYQAVLNSNVQPIVATFPLKTVRKEGETTNYVIDMTDYIRKDNEMFSFTSRVKDNIGASSMVDDASYIDTLKAFPQNIEIRTVRTFQRKKGGGSGLEKLLAAFFATSTTPLTYELNSSMLLLPKEPMKPRLHDDRVGYFAVSYKDFDENPQGVKYKANITRWRLEPKDEDREKYLRGELVEPKKPIIIYIDPATPKKWVPYLIQGVNDWQAAFEKAGFKNAIFGKEAPTDDPSWSLEDARHSAIVYKPSDIPNASGPHVHDPRSGEILETHINWYHNVMSLLYNWYIVQAGAIDPGARKPMFDDELMGELIRFVSSHEVGHTLGLRHNFGSSNTVPVEKLRDKIWVEANGHTPSIMDYARFNYVAQPEDNISRSGIFPRIGIYDKWAIEWVEYVPKDIQKKAVDFLNKELFTTPTWLMDDKLTERTGINTFNSIYRVQSSTLKQLLSSRTLDKMTDNELVNGAKAYTANDLFRDLKKSIWSDLQGGKKPDASQRSLQKTYVNALIGMLDKPKNSSGSLGSLGGYSLVAFDFPSEAPTIARGQLTDLKRDLTNAANASSGIYRSHYLNLKALIEAAFDVK